MPDVLISCTRILVLQYIVLRKLRCNSRQFTGLMNLTASETMENITRIGTDWKRHVRLYVARIIIDGPLEPVSYGYNIISQFSYRSRVFLS